MSGSQRTWAAKAKKGTARLKGCSWGPSGDEGPAEIELGSGDDREDSDGSAGTGTVIDTDKSRQLRRIWGGAEKRRNLITFLFLVPSLICPC